MVSQNGDPASTTSQGFENPDGRPTGDSAATISTRATVNLDPAGTLDGSQSTSLSDLRLSDIPTISRNAQTSEAAPTVTSPALNFTGNAATTVYGSDLVTALRVLACIVGACVAL